MLQHEKRESCPYIGEERGGDFVYGEERKGPPGGDQPRPLFKEHPFSMIPSFKTANPP